MIRPSIANPLTRNYRPGQGIKYKAPARHQSPQPNPRLNVRNLRCSPKRWEVLLLHFSRRSDRVGAFVIRLQLRWLRAQCVLPAVSLDDRLFVEFWEEFSA